VQRHGRTVVIRDIDALRELAALPKRELVREPHWLLAIRERA
jgi:hypothetical protein